jgi:SAM-dependent methyltransferase
LIDAAQDSLPVGSGARWVASYLLPILYEHLPQSGARPLHCLQIEPDDEEEAIYLRQLGHQCDILLFDPDRRTQCQWEQLPALGTISELPFAADSYDFILTGRMGKFAKNTPDRALFAAELARICRRGGAFLATTGNRYCPVDLTGNVSTLHLPGNTALTTCNEMERIFVTGAGFTSLKLQGVAGHFAWTTVPRALKFIPRLLEAFWRRVAVPDRRWIYGGPVNPTLVLLVRK